MNLYELCLKIGVEGFMHPNELEKLTELAANCDVLEVGSFKGLSAFCMAISAKSVYCVDTFRANSAGQFQLPDLTTFDDFKRATSKFANITYFIGSSAEAAAVNTGVYDMIFIDAMHTYEEVKEDINRWWKFLKPGGTMAFHDYGHSDFPGVKQAIDEVFGELQNRVVTLGWTTKR